MSGLSLNLIELLQILLSALLVLILPWRPFSEKYLRTLVGRLSNLSGKSCKAHCKEALANEHFDVHEWWATHILPDPYVENLEMMSPQEAENAIKPRTCLRILWARLSSLLFDALRANVGNPAFSRQCVSLLDSFLCGMPAAMPPCFG